MIAALILLPLLGVALIAAMPATSARWIALATSTAVFGFSLFLYSQFAAGTAPTANGYAFFQSLPWLSTDSIDSKFMVGMDGISVYLLLLATLMFPLAIWSGFKGVQKQEKFFYLLMLVLQTGTLGFFVSLDLLLMYVFFEMVLIPLYFLVGIWGGEGRAKASMKFFLYTLAGSLLMLVAILYAGTSASDTGFTTDFFKLRDAGFAPSTQAWLLAAFALSFGIKTPFFPFHTWQADTYAQSPTPATVIMAALLSKMGTYGLLRFCIGLFPQASLEYAWVFATLGVIGILYGGVLAAVQTDLKKIIAYSSLSHLGFIVLGLFAFTREAAAGSVFQMVAHGLSTGAIFLLLGMLQDRRQSMELHDYQGIARVMPVFSFFLVFSVLASAGLPGLSGFIGEFLIMTGAFSSGVISSSFAVVAALGVIVAAVYLLLMVRKTIFGENTNPANQSLTDLTSRERLILLPLAILMLVLGFWATPVQRHINADSDRVVQHVTGQTVAPGVAMK